MPASLAAAQPIDRIARPKVQRCGLIYGQRRARLPCETKRITFIIDTRPKQREQRAQIVALLRARARRALRGESSLCAGAAASPPPATAPGSDATQVDQSRGCRKCASVSIQAVFRLSGRAY